MNRPRSIASQSILKTAVLNFPFATAPGGGVTKGSSVGKDTFEGVPPYTGIDR